MSNVNDNELRQALSVLDAYKAQLEALTGQAQLFEMSLEETVRAKNTLEAMVAAKKGDTVLVPIGAATFVPMIVAGDVDALVGIGSRVTVEKSLKDTIAYLDSNIEEISAAMKKATEAINNVDNEARKLSAAVQQEYQRRQ